MSAGDRERVRDTEHRPTRGFPRNVLRGSHNPRKASMKQLCISSERPLSVLGTFPEHARSVLRSSSARFSLKSEQSEKQARWSPARFARGKIILGSVTTRSDTPPSDEPGGEGGVARDDIFACAVVVIIVIVVVVIVVIVIVVVIIVIV